MYNYVYIYIQYSELSLLVRGVSSHVWLPEGIGCIAKSWRTATASPWHQEDAFVVQEADAPDAADRVGDDGHLCAQGIQLVPKLPGHVLLERMQKPTSKMSGGWRKKGTSDDFQWTYFWCCLSKFIAL